MICNNCSNNNPDNSVFCSNCGSKLTEPTVPETPVITDISQEQSQAQAQTQPQPQPQTQIPQVNYVQFADNRTEEEKLPEKYKPISPWGYFGYELLFSIPIAGFILLIVFSCDSSNINRRNFARSHWCALIIVGIILAVYLTFFIIMGISLRSRFMF